MNSIAIGIDIGGTNTLVGAVDKEGNVIARHSFPTHTHSDYTIYLNQLVDEIRKMLGQVSGDISVEGIGVGAPNGNYYNGTIEFAPNLNFEGVVPVISYLQKHFDYPVQVLTNDANAAAVGEMVYGGARGMKDFIMITLGTGVGSGIVSGGKLLYGSDGFAGEIGHTIYDPDGRECGCGRRGCLETYTSAGGLKRTVFELLADSRTESALRAIPYDELSAHDIDKAARQGDPIARKAFDITGKILAVKLADAVAHTSPEAIFIFGGVAQARELLFEPLTKYFEQMLLTVYKGHVKIHPSALPPGDAAILGAAALVWQHQSN
ncbi:MAG: ROK family protein [Bacteroidales bacterium]